jgi:hypothetical protein
MAVVMQAAKNGPKAPRRPLRVESIWKGKRPYEARAVGIETPHVIPKASAKNTTSEYGFDTMEVEAISATPSTETIIGDT